ncbi:hypothetical protein MKK88_33625 [Methylobacterium sp. E-005]|uniref:hypothetical protein n=1 Tax=Methylobacterium sp. E-005 TaxID=2836549 RepID=UPI001FB8E948|nr:hypothetical protein [Methylobacterium sp. E-005]MCJ2090887.1 hypothetical protein [Methylobacterium sp. E-005]
MPEIPELDPYEALTHIRTFARVALNNPEPTERAYEQVLREILKACDLALPAKRRASRKPQPD